LSATVRHAQSDRRSLRSDVELSARFANPLLDYEQVLRF
jgi:hypothetical protein